jgi:uncharacterized protein (TIGR00251 family)
MAKLPHMPELDPLWQSGQVFAVKVTPKASRDRVAFTGELRVWVTAAPDKGRANAAVIAALAQAFGIAKSRIELVRGETSCDKQFRVMP